MDGQGIRHGRLEALDRPGGRTELRISPATPEDVLDAIRRGRGAGAASWLILAAIVPVGFVAALSARAGTPMACFGYPAAGLGLLPWLAWELNLAKLARVHYSVAGPGRDLLHGVERLAEGWMQVGATWSIGDGARAADPKRNAGAGTVVARERARVALAPLPGLITDARIGRVEAAGRTLHLLPDRAPLGEGATLSESTYDALRATHGSTRFVETEGLPGDAQVVAETWAHVNKDGGPDRRFKANRRLPVAPYGDLKLGLGKGAASWHYQTSKPGAAGEIAGRFEALGRASATPRALTRPGGAPSIPADLDPPVGRSLVALATERVASLPGLGGVRHLPEWLRSLLLGAVVALPIAILMTTTLRADRAVGPSSGIDGPAAGSREDPPGLRGEP